MVVKSVDALIAFVAVTRSLRSYNITVRAYILGIILEQQVQYALILPGFEMAGVNICEIYSHGYLDDEQELRKAYKSHASNRISEVGKDIVM